MREAPAPWRAQRGTPGRLRGVPRPERGARASRRSTAAFFEPGTVFTGIAARGTVPRSPAVLGLQAPPAGTASRSASGKSLEDALREPEWRLISTHRSGCQSEIQTFWYKGIGHRSTAWRDGGQGVSPKDQGGARRGGEEIRARTNILVPYSYASGQTLSVSRDGVKSL